MKIIQVLDALDYGDGVSNDVINKYNLFKEMGYESEIYSKWFDDRVGNVRRDISKLTVEKDDILLHHYSGKSNILDEVILKKCTKVLVYHNITPSFFFNNNVKGEMLNEGEKQLKKINGYYDFFLADSEFNVQDLRKIGVYSNVDVMPIYVDFSNIDTWLKSQRKELNYDISNTKMFLFVGRVAPNKKHEDIIDIFNYYYSKIDCNCNLVFVGNYNDYMEYYMKLQNKIKGLDLTNNVKFTGKVDNNKLYEYYCKADLFICMSEHEGFCIPLLESMYYRIPTIAYQEGAIKTTMGNAGVLINLKSIDKIAKLIYIININQDVREQIIDKQTRWIENFSKKNIEEKLKLLVNKWSGGKNFE